MTARASRGAAAPEVLHRDRRLAFPNTGDANAGFDNSTSVDGRDGQFAVEDRAIDNRGSNLLGADEHRRSVWRDEPRGISSSDDRAA